MFWRRKLVTSVPRERTPRRCAPLKAPRKGNKLKQRTRTLNPTGTRSMLIKFVLQSKCFKHEHHVSVRHILVFTRSIVFVSSFLSNATILRTYYHFVIAPLLTPFSFLLLNAPTELLLLSPVFLVPLALPLLLSSPLLSYRLSHLLFSLSLEPSTLLVAPHALSSAPLLSSRARFLLFSLNLVGFSLVVFSCPVSLFPFASSFHSACVS